MRTISRLQKFEIENGSTLKSECFGQWCKCLLVENILADYHLADYHLFDAVKRRLVNQLQTHINHSHRCVKKAHLAILAKLFEQLCSCPSFKVDYK
jgi:hypothetical protein